MNYKHLLLLLLLCACSGLHGQPGSIDTTFNPTDMGFLNGDGTNGDITTIALQPDGKIIIGGYFWTYNSIERNRIARLNANSIADWGFDPGSGSHSSVNAIVYQPDGKILIGGAFQSYNGISRSNIARLNDNGSFDTSFDPGAGANAMVSAIALQPDGKILIGGLFYRFDGISRNGIARLNADGSLDTSFDPGIGADGQVNSIDLQPDGKILIGGGFTNYDGVARRHVARLNADGSLDTGFDPGTGADGILNAIQLQPDGKILIGGGFASYNGVALNKIARLNADGSLDTSFNPGTGVSEVLYAIKLQPDGKILIGGRFKSYNGISRSNIARLNADGSLDAGFDTGSGANSTVLAIALQPDGKIVIGGQFTSCHDKLRNRISRLNPDGSLDTGFSPGTGANNAVNTIVLQPDKKILIGGSFTNYNGTIRRHIARLNADGSLDTSFDPGTGADRTVNAIVLQPDGKILAGGNFDLFNGIVRNSIARLHADGSLDTSFDPGTGPWNGGVNGIVLQPDGKILICGSFTSFNGIVRKNIARLNSDGSLDMSFDPGMGPSHAVYALALQPDGKILIGGHLKQYNGTSRRGIARLNADGSLDASFNPGSGVDFVVNTISLQTDGKILIGGQFSNYNGVGLSNIARLNANGSLDMGFNAIVGPSFFAINALTLQPDGKILIGGSFYTYNGAACRYIARLNANGSLDTEFDTGKSADAYVYCLALQPDGKVLIGGIFGSYNGSGRNRIARLNGDSGSSSIQKDGADAGAPTLFPNPGSGQFKLRLPAQAASTALHATNIRFFDATGRCVCTEAFMFANGAERRIDLSHLPAGIYGWTLRVDGKDYTGKVVKE